MGQRQSDPWPRERLDYATGRDKERLQFVLRGRSHTLSSERQEPVHRGIGAAVDDFVYRLL